MPHRLVKAYLVAACLSSLVSIVGADEFPEPRDSEQESAARPLPAAEAAAGFRAPDGFRVGVFASEPEVMNPIGMAWDARGRLWIAENFTYAERSLRFDLGLRDRVLIFEDADGDGRSDRRTVFTDEIQQLASVEIGRGGVWLLAPPRLLFVPDRDGNDVPDGPAEAVLDGFELARENHHTFANGLRWGPDGWLYGRCGASSPGRIGTPGTPDADRVPLFGGIWRYHPVHRTFEVLCHGTTNPWGLDWTESGEGFFVNTVNGHLWHLIPGAHFRRPHTRDPNPLVYDAMEMHADHYHWDTGAGHPPSGAAGPEQDRFGGGHAHSGAMIYLGDAWPASYRGKLLTLNFHGRRANVERLERSGTGFVARHEPDMLFSPDPFFRGIDLSYGPDGGVYMLDWSDTGECHETTGVHRNSGRIFKVTHDDARDRAGSRTGEDLAQRTPEALAALHTAENEWHVRQARRLLVGTASDEGLPPAASAALRASADPAQPPGVRIKALWTLHATGAADRETALRALADPAEEVRVWAIRSLIDHWPLDTIHGRRPTRPEAAERDVVEMLVRQAHADESGLVRLALASTLQRLPVESRAELASALAARSEDAEDPNQPRLVWFGLMPLVSARPADLVEVARSARLPLLRRWIARALAGAIDADADPVDQLVTFSAASGDPSVTADLIAGLAEGLAGRRQAPEPASWAVLVAKAEKGDSVLRSRVRELSAVFGDGRALDQLVSLALDTTADPGARKAALETLITQRPPQLRSVCEKLLSERFMNGLAARGLATFEDPAVGRTLVARYRSFHPTERPAVIETLASRPSFAAALLDAVAAEKIPAGDIGAFQARQIDGFGDEALSARLREAWGEVRESPAEQRDAMAALKAKLTETLPHADLPAGRLVFEKTCATCHRLYGRGKEVGPDLTGAGRHDLDYLVQNIVDPSAVVSADFRMSTIALSDGRVISGMILRETGQVVTVQTTEGPVSIDRAEIELVSPTALSQMPDGLLRTLSEDQVRDLFGYLRHPVQVPLPEAAETGN